MIAAPPPSLARYTNRPFGRQRTHTKHLVMVPPGPAAPRPVGPGQPRADALGTFSASPG